MKTLAPALLTLLVAAACGAPATAPTTPVPPTSAAPADPTAAAGSGPGTSTEAGLAPRPFTAEQIRAGMPLGHRLRYRISQEGQPTIEELWVVTANTPESATIATQVFGTDGKLIRDDGPKTETWADLRAHANFPVQMTKIETTTVEVPAGKFDVSRYVVGRFDGGVMTFDFAPSLPGPPVRLVQEAGGKVVNKMELLERK